MNPLLPRAAALAALSLLASTQRSAPAPARPSARAELATALFAGGCFWSMEHPFDQLRGVVAVSVGYTGGHTNNPTYREGAAGPTGDLETVQGTCGPAAAQF